MSDFRGEAIKRGVVDLRRVPLGALHVPEERRGHVLQNLLVLDFVRLHGDAGQAEDEHHKHFPGAAPHHLDSIRRGTREIVIEGKTV